MAGSVHCSHEGRDVKSQREGETKRKGWGEMDRGGDRDLLSSGFFDGSHDHLYNKRLIANDSNKKREWERGREGGRDITSIQTHSAIQVSCSGDQDNKTCLSSEAQTDKFTNKITAWNLKEWFEPSDSPSQKLNLTDRNLYTEHPVSYYNTQPV